MLKDLTISTHQNVNTRSSTLLAETASHDVSECQQSHGSDSSETSSPVIKYTFQDNDQTLVGNRRKVMTNDVVLGSCQYYQSASARGLLARLCTSMIGNKFSQVAYIYIANACYLYFHSLVWRKLMQHLVITSTGKSAWLARKA